MLWLKAFHFIFVVAWFSGLFYLPRLFVYHAGSINAAMNERFAFMEKRLYYFVLQPSAVLTILSGVALIHLRGGSDLHASWLQLKLGLVLILVCYHFFLGYLLRAFLDNRNQHQAIFYRWLNEFPTLILIGIIFLVVLKPFI